MSACAPSGTVGSNALPNGNVASRQAVALPSDVGGAGGRRDKLRQMPQPLSSPTHSRLIHPRAWLLVAGLGAWMALSGCAALRTGPTEGEPGDESATTAAKRSLPPAVNRITRTLLITPEPDQAWELFALPGKRAIPFEATSVLGRPALRVRADRSVSILRQRFASPAVNVGQLDFSWKIDGLPMGADMRDVQTEDSPVRVVLAFGGDRSRLSPRAHRVSELSRLITGEDLPFATLSYVWSAHEPLETVILNPRTDRIRKLVVATGAGQLGQWLDYRRDVRADFVRAFGEQPGPLLAIALMTDTDNTESALQAWYGALHLRQASGARADAPALPVMPLPAGRILQPNTGHPG